MNLLGHTVLQEEGNSEGGWNTDKHSLGKLWVIMGVAGLKSRLQGNNYKGAGVLVETDPMQVVVALRKLHLQPRAWSRICGPYIMKTRQTTQNSYLL